MRNQNFMAIILDDHPLVCQTLAAQVAEQGDGVGIGYQGADVQGALNALDGNHEWIALVDADLGIGIPAPEVVATLTEAGVRVALVSAQDHPATVQQCIVAGALAFLPKRDIATNLQEVIRALAENRLLRSVDLLTMLTPSPGSPMTFDASTNQVLAFASAGLPTQVIARRVGIHPEQVTAIVNDVWRAYAGGRA